MFEHSVCLKIPGKLGAGSRQLCSEEEDNLEVLPSAFLAERYLAPWDFCWLEEGLSCLTRPCSMVYHFIKLPSCRIAPCPTLQISLSTCPAIELQLMSGSGGRPQSNHIFPAEWRREGDLQRRFVNLYYLPSAFEKLIFNRHPYPDSLAAKVDRLRCPR